MRNEVDDFSQKMKDEGLVQGELAAVFDENMGIYLTRTYRAHQDKKWKRENIPDEIINRAYATLRSYYPDYTEAEIDGLIDYLLGEKGEPISPFEFLRGATGQGGKMGEKDLSILKKRILEDQDIRDLMGEYKDPLYNYTTSVAKMADLLARHRFLKYTKEVGKGNFLFDRPTKTEQGSFSSPIDATKSKTMEPLSGLYTTPEIAKSIESFSSMGTKDPLLRAYMQWFNTPLKYGKTILSPNTHTRNYVA